MEFPKLKFDQDLCGTCDMNSTLGFRQCFNNEIPKVSWGRRGPDGPSPLKRKLYLQCSLIFISFCDYRDFHHSVHRIDDQGDQANKALHSKDIFRSVKNKCKSM